jgi:hypothetical protein
LEASEYEHALVNALITQVGPGIQVYDSSTTQKLGRQLLHGISGHARFKEQVSKFVFTHHTV